MASLQSLRRDVEKLKYGQHLACIYRNREEQFATVIPFIYAGLKNGEKCIYIADENTKDEIIQAFKEVTDIDKYLKSGQLELLTKSEAYLKDGYFDPDRMIELLKQVQEKALKDGYKGLRVTGEMTWILTTWPGVERIIEYEAKLNYFFPESMCTALCQYNENKFKPEILLEVIHTHPFLIIYDTLYENPHYSPPDEFFAQLRGEIHRDMYEKVRNNVINKKKIENKIIEQEEEKNLILNSISEFITYYGRDKRVVWANRASANVVSGSPEDAIGKYCEEIWQCGDIPCNVCPTYRAWESGMQEEGEIMRPDGRIWLARASPVYDCNELAGIVVVARDITKRKKAEEALKSSEELYRTLVMTSPEAVTVTDLEGRITHVSDRTLMVHGVESTEEIIGKSAFEFIAPEDREKALNNLQITLKEGAVKNVEYVMLKGDGSRFIGELNAALVKDSEGNPKAFIATVRDITSRKKAEEQIRTSLREKEVLLKEIHHRVRNNMQVISSLLSLQSSHINDGTVMNVFRDIQNRIKSMALVHNQLYQSEDFSEVGFNQYIETLVSALVQSYKRDHEPIAVNIDAENISLGIDTAIPCGLVISELVSNALKHTFPDGKGRIDIKFHRTDENEIELIVKDNGMSSPDGGDFRNTESLELELATILVEDQLSGNISMEKGEGTEFLIKFRR